MKKLLYVFIFVYCHLAYAGMNIPFPEKLSGLKVISINDIKDPNTKQQILKRNNLLNERGCIPTHDKNELRYLKYLFFIQQYAAKQIEKHKNDTNINDSHLKSGVEKIKLTFDYSPVSQLPLKTEVGFSPNGMLIEDKWNGIKELFFSPSTGMCSIEIMDFKASNGGSQIIAELKTARVNSKYASYEVIGNADAGYLYTLNWYDDRYFFELNCGRKDLSSDMKERLLKAAENIDDSVSH